MSQSTNSIFTRIALTLLATALIVATNVSAANAFDLFGESKKDAAKEGEPLWGEVENPVPIKPIGVPATFADLAEQVSPAVVNIQVTVSQASRFAIPPQFREFHGFPFEVPEHGFGPSHGEGSGFVISSSGYIVTNGHVIDGASKIEVQFLNGKKLDAEIVGLDEKTDIALIKVETEEPLQAIPLGNSDAVRPGEWVVAIGNAMSLEHSVTAGIVSAKHRYLARGSYDDFIQTDAAINPGNSGGPLINLAGEVIGINTAINPQANTIGFAVPINMAKQILPQLHETGHVKRSWLGVEIRELTDELKEGTGTDHGALVRQVLPATPAMRAGIESGDVIVSFDGKRVESHRQLPTIVSSAPMDREIEVEVIRNGERKNIEVTLAAMEEPEQRFAQRRDPLGRDPGSDAALDAFGLDAQDMTPELAEQLDLEDDNGVIVTRVSADSAADRAGLKRGDVILEVEGNVVHSREELDASLEEADDGAVLLVRREAATLFIPIKRAG